MFRVLQTPVTVAPTCRGELGGERAHAAGRPDDQHSVPALDPAPRQAEVGGDGGQGQRGGVLERQRLRLARQATMGYRGVLSERRVVLTQHLVADLPAGDAGPEGLDRAGEVAAADALARPLAAESAAVHEPGDPGLTAHDVPVRGVDRRRGDPHEHLPGRRLGTVDVLEAGHVGRAVDVLHQRLHASPSAVRPTGPDRPFDASGGASVHPWGSTLTHPPDQAGPALPVRVPEATATWDSAAARSQHASRLRRTAQTTRALLDVAGDGLLIA